MSCNKCDDCTIFDTSKDFGTQLDEQSKSIRNMLLAVRMSSVENVLYKTLYQMACSDNQFVEAIKALDKRAGKDWTQTITDIIAVNDSQTKYLDALKAFETPHYTTLANHLSPTDDQTVIPLSDDVRKYDDVIITYKSGSSVYTLLANPNDFDFSDTIVNNVDNSSDTTIIDNYAMTVNTWSWGDTSEFVNSETGLWFGTDGKSLRKGLLAYLITSNVLLNTGGKPTSSFHRFDKSANVTTGTYSNQSVHIEKVQGVNYHVIP